MQRSSPRAPDAVMLSAIAVAVVVGKLMFAGIPAPEWSAGAREDGSHASCPDSGHAINEASASDIETALEPVNDAAAAQAVESAAWSYRDSFIAAPRDAAPPPAKAAPSPAHAPGFWLPRH